MVSHHANPSHKLLPVWTVLAVVLCAGCALQVTAQGTQAERIVPEDRSASIMDALQKAKADVTATRHYPEAAVRSVRSILASWETLPEEFTNLAKMITVLAFGNKIPSEGDDAPITRFQYPAHVPIEAIEYNDKWYQVHVLLTGTIDMCHNFHDGFENIWYERDNSCFGVTPDDQSNWIPCGGPPMCKISFGTSPAG